MEGKRNVGSALAQLMSNDTARPSAIGNGTAKRLKRWRLGDLAQNSEELQ
jgi:hypothetical protein